MGDYEFTIHEKNFMFAFPNNINVDTTYYYNGKMVKIENDDKKNRLIEITYSDSKKLIVNLDKDCNLSGGYGISGHFESKNDIKAVYSWRAGGGNGSTEITGKKLK